MNYKRYNIAFGSNLGNRRQAFDKAALLLGERFGQIEKTANLIETEALLLPGELPGSQPPYLNTVLIIKSLLEPLPALHLLHEIEHELGRVRGKKWASRTVDLDIIGIDQEIINLTELTVPHAEMHKRDFVLKPLVEIWPEWRHPVLNKSANQLLKEIA